MGLRVENALIRVARMGLGVFATGIYPDHICNAVVRAASHMPQGTETLTLVVTGHSAEKTVAKGSSCYDEIRVHWERAWLPLDYFS